jgi:small-conductance mechanosensitive channel
MEINNINSNLISELNNINENTNTNNLKSSENEIVSNEANKLSSSYLISQDITSKRSNLHSNLNQYISTISQNQIELSNLNQQDQILNTIETTISTVQNSNNISQASNNVHGNLIELMAKYDKLNPSLQLVSTGNEDTTSHAYFDGVFGSTPLKIEQLSTDVQQKQASIKEHIQIVSNNIENTQDKALGAIKEEVQKTQEAQPFKNVDFGKHTSDFSSANINSVIGSIALSQANAIPSNSPKLLS